MLPSKQKLQEIGKTLQDTRIKENITLETVVEKTLIPKRVLLAIERGDVRELPEAFYTKALINKYAVAIKLPKLLSEENNIIEDIEDGEKSSGKKSLRNRLIRNKPTAKKSNSQRLPTFQLKSSHLYFIYVVLVVVAVSAIANLVEKPTVVDNPTLPQQEVTQGTVQTINNSTPTTISSVSPSQFVSQSNSNNSESVVVDITLKDRCWLKVMVDGKVEFEGTLPKGTRRSWTGREQINILAGNAGGVVITYNHGQEKLLGKPGQVEEVTYTVN